MEKYSRRNILLFIVFFPVGVLIKLFIVKNFPNILFLNRSMIIWGILIFGLIRNSIKRNNWILYEYLQKPQFVILRNILLGYLGGIAFISLIFSK